MSYNEELFLNAVQNSYIKYKQHGARSTEKLKPLHLFAAETLRAIWGNDAQLHYLGDGVKELTVGGKYYPKDIDVTVMLNNNPVLCLGIKFVTSNYKQNANNYIENMMGETANIQANKIPYAQLIILRYETPYYKKNDTNSASKIETISKKDLQKYLNLMFEPHQPHRPQMLGLHLVDINEQTETVCSTNLTSAFGKEFTQLVQNTFSVYTMFKQIENYKTYLSTKVD